MPLAVDPALPPRNIRPLTTIRRPRLHMPKQADATPLPVTRQLAWHAASSTPTRGAAEPEINRPAIATPLPLRRGFGILLDTGANVDCRPVLLLQFARMGQVYARSVAGIARPRVALLSNGAEPGKGNELVRAAHGLLAEALPDFVGNMEGRDLFKGRAEVIVCDIDQQRLNEAREFGAGQTALPADLAATIQSATSGRGVALALELSGAVPAMQQGLDLLRIGGRFIWVGAVSPTPAVSINPEQIVRNLITIQGVHNYTPLDLEAALNFLADSQEKYPFAKLVPESYALEQAETALQTAAQGKAPRIMITLN